MLRGRVDHPLSVTGWEQMWRAVGLPEGNDDLSGSSPTGGDIHAGGSLPWTDIVTSPLLRCRAFGERLAGRSGLPLTVGRDWQEIDYGDWDGMALADWRKTAAYQFREFRKDMSALRPPNGEHFLDFRSRILAAWERLLKLPDGSHVLLITHGGVMRVILPTILGIPLNRNGVLEIPFACLSRLETSQSAWGNHVRLIGHNVASMGMGRNEGLG